VTNVGARTKLLRPRLVAIAWCLATLISLLLLRAPHAGPGIYYVFVAIGWPYFYYDEQGTAVAFCLSAFVELAYVVGVQVFLTVIGLAGKAADRS
jgi:hypothetical protein